MVFDHFCGLYGCRLHPLSDQANQAKIVFPIRKLGQVLVQSGSFFSCHLPLKRINSEKYTERKFMNNIRGGLSILALSLVLITSFPQSALPAMFDYYQGYPKEQIELLGSVSLLLESMIMLVLNGFLGVYFLSDFRLARSSHPLYRGTAPFWYQGSITLSLRCGILFGLGVGMINASHFHHQ